MRPASIFWIIQLSNSRVTDDLYELVISEKEIFFHDIPRGIFYTFED